MAEALGVAAGVLQFIDVGLRLYSKLDRLCSNIRDAPEIIQDLHISLRQQLELAQKIRDDHDTLFQSLTSPDLVDVPLRHYVNQIQKLDGLLDDVAGDENDPVWRRGWKGFRTAKRKDDILEICARLERQKSSLSMWLAETNLKLSSEIKSNLGQAYQSIQQTVSLVQNIDATSSKNAVAFEQMHPQVGQLHQTSSEILKNTRQMVPQTDETHQMSATILVETKEILLQSQRIDSNSNSTRLNVEEILPKVDQISADTQLLTREIQSMRDNWSCLIKSNPALQNTVNQVLDQPKPLMESLEDLNPFDISSNEFLRLFSQDIEAEFQGHQSSMRCTCRPKSHTNHWEPISMFHFKRSFRTKHLSHCPKYPTSEQSIELITTFVPPPWLFARRIDLSLQIRNWNTRRGFSVSPIVIGTSRLVDTATSPAFQAFYNTRTLLVSSGFRHSASYIPDLQAVLHELYQNQKASPLDEDHLGNTMLHEVICLYVRQQALRTKRRPGGCTPGDEYILLIEFLLDNGANPNVLSIENPPIWDKPIYHSGTPLDLFAQRMIGFKSYPFSASEMVRNVTIYKKLVGNGCEFSRPLNSTKRIHPQYCSTHFSKEALEFRCFPEQVELHGHEHLVSVILQHSEPEFFRVVQRVNINHISSINGLTALHFAVQWPRALEYLINSGANVNAKDHYSRRPIHIAVALGSPQAVKLLLQADCALATPWRTSLLKMALKLQDPEKYHIVNAVVGALINRHQRFLTHARAVLPEEEFLNFGISRSVKLEKRVPDIKNALLLHGFQIPEALDLDDEGVYDTAGLHGSIRMTPQIAETLWQAGFTDIHSPNKDGLSPILQSWSIADFDMIAWFIRKGANEFSRHVNVASSGLHFYAWRISHHVCFSKRNPVQVSCDIPQIMQLQQEPSLAHDDCSCLCSPRGCTPVSILIKKSYDRYPGWPKKLSYRSWLKNTAPSPSLLRQYSHDCIRILIFEAMKLNHTCCKFREGVPYATAPKSSFQVQLWYGLKENRLDEYMAEYEIYYDKYDGPIDLLPFTFLETFVLKDR